MRSSILNKINKEKKTHGGEREAMHRETRQPKAADDTQLLSLFGCTHLVSTSSLAKDFDASSSSCDTIKEEEKERKENETS